MDKKIEEDLRLKALRDKAAEVVKNEDVMQYIEARIDAKIKSIEERNTFSLKQLNEFRSVSQMIQVLKDIIEKHKMDALLILQKEYDKHRQEVRRLIEKEIAEHYAGGGSNEVIQRVIEEEFLKVMSNFKGEKVLNKIMQAHVNKFNATISKDILKRMSECSCVQLELLNNAIRQVEEKEALAFSEIHSKRLQLVGGVSDE